MCLMAYEIRANHIVAVGTLEVADVHRTEVETYVEEELSMEILADAEPVLRINGGQDGSLFSQLVASSEGIEVALSKPLDLRADHVVSGNMVLPFEGETFVNLLTILENSDFPIAGEIEYRHMREITKLKASTQLEISLDELALRHLSEHFSNAREHILSSQLWDFQVVGFSWMCNLWEQSLGGILADEMGVGKTIQLLALIAHVEKNMVSSKPILVIVPNNLLLTWSREVVKHAPKLAAKTHLHAGPDRSRDFRFLEGEKVIFTTYSMVSQDISFLALIDFEMVICDEAHWAKDPLAQRANALKSLRANTIFLATGTPIQNRLLDLWNLIDIVDRGLLGLYDEFLATCSNSPAEAKALGQLVEHRILRRTQADAGLELPESYEQVIPLALDESERETYMQIRKGTHPDFLGSRGRGLISPQRQFAAHSQSLEDRGEPNVGEKAEFLLAKLAEIDSLGEKAIVFVSDCNSARRLYTELVSQAFPDWYCALLDGTTPPDARFGILERFRSFAGSGALFLNPVVSGEGETIVEANHVFHMNPGWNAAKLDQSSFRVRRPGQKKTVFIYQLFYVGTIEEVLLELIDNKREISDAALEAAEKRLDNTQQTFHVLRGQANG